MQALICEIKATHEQSTKFFLSLSLDKQNNKNCTWTIQWNGKRISSPIRKGSPKMLGILIFHDDERENDFDAIRISYY